MNKKTTRIFAVLFSLVMLFSTAAFAFAAEGETEEPSFSLESPYEYEEVNRLLSFDAKSAVLTISGNGNFISSEKNFWKYINAIAPFCKKIRLTKDAVLRNRDAHGSDYYLFEKALCALTNVEAFEVEEGSSDYAVRNGVLYDSTVTSLVHYPAGKTDERYKMESRTMEIRPYAFSNTQHLRFLEFNYSHVLLPMPSLLANSVSDGSRRHFFKIDAYGLGSYEPQTDKEQESSIRTLIWYGEEKDLREIAAKHNGNNILSSASVSCQSTSIINDLTVFSNRMLFVLGLSKENRNKAKNSLGEQLTEAIKDIGSLLDWELLTTLIG
ncbi:MAG: hypothetical protein IJU56_01855 [Clostridia bacterium]|nr:hypothetical protein [Clostridia bacterium]